MSLFEKLLISKEDDGFEEQTPEIPDVKPNQEEIPLTPKVKGDHWEENHPGEVQKIIDSINKEEEAEKKHEQITDKIIEERDKKMN